VDMPPIFLFLGMDFGIAVHLACGGLQDPGLDAFGQPEHVDGAHDAGLDGFNRVVLVMDRRGRAFQVVDLIHFQENGHGDIMADELEIPAIAKVFDIALGAREKIVHANHVMPLPDQQFAQLRAQKARASGDQNPLHFFLLPFMYLPSSKWLMPIKVKSGSTEWIACEWPPSKGASPPVAITEGFRIPVSANMALSRYSTWPSVPCSMPMRKASSVVLPMARSVQRNSTSESLAAVCARLRRELCIPGHMMPPK